MKTCSKCMESLPEVEFSVHRGKPDGLQPYCRKCTREYHALYKPAYWERNKHAMMEKDRERFLANRAGSVAHQAVYRALRKGLIHRKPCEICGAAPAVAHHEDYSRPLDVHWLCYRHHREIHTGYLDTDWSGHGPEEATDQDRARGASR